MDAPTITVTTQVDPVQRSRPTETGIGAIIGISRTGPAGRLLTPDDKLTSQDAWVDEYAGGSLANGRLAYSIDYDWVEEFFRDGGAELYYARVLGPNPVKATINLAGTGTSLIVTADEYGDLANTKKIKVIQGPVGGAGYRVVQYFENDGTTLIDQTSEFNDRTLVNGVHLGADSNVPVTITLGGGSGLPAVAAATALSGGTDDHANVTQTQIDAALTYLSADLGPVNVAAPNWGTAATGLSLLAHGAAYGRYAAIDTVDTATKATVTTQLASLQGTANGEHGTLVHPWIEIPEIAFGGLPRAVPASALQLAKWAQTDATDGAGPNQAAAGDFGTSAYATGVRATYSRMPKGASDADDLADAGCTLVILDNGRVKVFDNLTLVDPDGPKADLIQNNTVRYIKAKVAEFTADAASELFRKINRDNLANWNIKMSGRLIRDLANGDLFPDDDDPRPETAFNVDTGGNATTGPNTPATMNAGQMNVNIALRPVRGARMINLSISTVAMTRPVS